MAAVLDHPAAAARVRVAGHRHRLAGPVDHLGAVERQGADGLGVLAVAAADRADVADVVGAQDRVERVDPVAEQLDPAVVDVVRRAGALAAPDVVLRRAMHDLAGRRDDEQRVEEAVVHHLRPARLALDDDVGPVHLRQAGQPLGLRTGDVDEQLARGERVRQIEGLVGEAGEGALGEGDQLHRHVDVDHRHGGVNVVLDDVEVDLDVLSLGHAVDDRREADGHVRRDRLAGGPSGPPALLGAGHARGESP